MNEIMIFSNNDFGEIRILTIDGEPWFVGRDIAKALGYAKPEGAVAKHCRHPLKRGIPHPQSPDKTIEALVIPEGDMYRLISKSKLRSAERFEEWVFDEVLPTIRKTGQYKQAKLPMTIPEQIQLIAQGYVELRAEIDSVKADLESFKNDMPILGIEETKISNAVKKKGVECLGGKESNAYNDKSLRGRLYSDLHRQLRREFGVSTYKAIKRNQADTAISIIRQYVPPLVLAETIETVNAQQVLDI
ncbi:MAG: ORF6C domain-containing protein [Roseburia sp.]|nr:ORF6C domain-containing protein [Roseburia sp.]